MVARDFTFRSAGTRLAGKFLAGDPAVNWTIILLTGDSKKGTLSDTWTGAVSTLRESGFGLFLFDFHSQGRSEGDRRELTLSRGVQNLEDALPLARELSPHASVGYFASSFGAAVLLAAMDSIPAPQAITFKSPAVVLAEAYEREHGSMEAMERWRSAGVSEVNGLSYAAYADARAYELYEQASSITCPTLIVHGTADEIVPVAQSRRLANAIGRNARLVEIPHGDHNYKTPGAMTALLNETVLFFNACVWQ
jgi:alpha-beta hydrolase superfamily lysophospholipase